MGKIIADNSLLRLLLAPRRPSALLLLLLLYESRSLGRTDVAGDVLGLDPVQLGHPAPGVLQPVPGHLEHLLGGVAAPLVGLAGGDLGEVLDVLRQLAVDLLEGGEELGHQLLHVLLTGVAAALVRQARAHLSFNKN